MESPQSIDLKNESNRLNTFAGWPVSFIISPISLAAAGFYYTKQTDKVKCAFCNICIRHWEFGDNAVDKHKLHNPDCSFILGQDCGNIPIIVGIQSRGEFVENHKETEEANVPRNKSANIKFSYSDLEEENRLLKEVRLCKICLDQELGVVLLPCAHLVACITCVSSLRVCPICRQTIKSYVRTFLS